MTVKNLMERYEGFGNTIKSLMEYSQGNKNVRGVVADLISKVNHEETPAPNIKTVLVCFT